MVFMRANFGVTEQTLRRQKLSNIQLSELNASGFTHTSTDLYEYLKHLVSDIKKKLPCESSIEAYLWSYRHSGYSVVSFDLMEGEKYYPITITICNEPDYAHLDEPDFSDITEAMHMIGILSQSLDLKISAGRTGNEINEALLERPLSGKETNGKLKLLKFDTHEDG